jgi:hypothetical protein
MIGNCNTKKIKPVIIQCGKDFYIGLVNNEKEDRYYKLVEEEHRISEDYIYEMTPTLYFKVSCAFKNKGLVYNLKKHKHIFNDRK